MRPQRSSSSNVHHYSSSQYRSAGGAIMDKIRDIWEDFMDRDWSMTFAIIGMWMAVLVFGSIIIIVNGGFSVLGLNITAASFNDAGKLFWAAVSAIQFPVPVKVSGLPTTQPLVPWLGVASASFLQITVLYRRSRGLYVPMYILLFTVFLSLYDLGTTYSGLGTVKWIVSAGWVVRLILTILLTFGVETIIGLMLRERWIQRNSTAP